VPPSPRSSRLAGVVYAPPLAATVAPPTVGRRLLGTCARLGPPDRDPTARVSLDPSPRGSNLCRHAHKQPGPTDQIRHRRVKPALTCRFCKKTPLFFKFTSRSSHLSVFLAVRSCFLCFSPGSLVFYTV
jgi:hypothetical protein